MRRFVVRIQFGEGKAREFIRMAFAAHKLQGDIERHYPDAKVLEVYAL
jgi:hypothetical protein